MHSIANAVRAELNSVTVELIVRLALRKGKGRGDEEVHMSPCTTFISVVCEPHRTPFAAVIHSVDERNWFLPKCSDVQKVVQKEAAGLAAQRKFAQTTCGNRTRG